MGAAGPSYGYDANGSLTSKTAGGVTTSFAYDAERRPVRVSQGSSTLARFAYDGDGVRRKRLDSFGVVHYVSGSCEVDKGDGRTRITETVTKLYSFAGRLIAVRKGGVLRYVGTDHLGSTIQVTDSSFVAQSQGQQRYTPFGISRDSGASIPTDHLFTSQIRDASIGLYWYASRAYDPAQGRFCQPDSIVPSPGDPQSLNRYSYVRNNPLRYTDPTGHVPQGPILRKDYGEGTAGDDQFWRDILTREGDSGTISSGPGGAYIARGAAIVAEVATPGALAPQPGLRFPPAEDVLKLIAAQLAAAGLLAALEAISKGLQERPEQPYYWRIEDTDEGATSIENTGLLYGYPPQYSDIPAVQARWGRLPRDRRGIEFQTPILPAPFSPPSGPYWHGVGPKGGPPTPGVTTLTDLAGNSVAVIPVRVTENRQRPGARLEAPTPATQAAAALHVGV